MGRLEQTRKNASARPEYLNEQGMIFGASYVSSAIVPDGSEPPHVDDPVTDYVPSARPGGRAPHVSFEHDGQQMSTIDVVGNGFALLTASGGHAWIEAAKGLDGTLALRTLAIEDDSFASTYELENSGAVLVRPDGHVGWRSRSSTQNPSRTLRDALATILGTNG
jgi:hypothetical protein